MQRSVGFAKARITWLLAVIVGVKLVCAQPALAQTGPDLQREQRDQIEQWRRQALRPADLPDATAPAMWLPPVPDERPCVNLKSVAFVVAGTSTTADAAPLPWRLIEPPADFLGVCVGVGSLQRLQANLLGRLHALGYVTSTLSLAEQDLQSGELKFSLYWGRIGQVQIESAARQASVDAGPAPNALALRPGSVLNLRDIEHTLENLARLPSQAARIVIEPSTEPHTSDLRIVVSPQSRWHGSLGLDAAELQRQSPWDAQAQIWLDAPMGISDQLLVAASGTPEPTGEQRIKRHSVYVLWSLPLGRHLLSTSASSARNSRSIAGGVGRFVERGEEDRASLRWQWTPWRGADWRSQVWAAWNERRSRSFIDEVELLSRRRIAGDLSVGGSHWHRLGCGEARVEVESTETRRQARVAEFQDLQAPMPRQWRVQLDLHCSWPGGQVGAETSEPSTPWTWALSAWTQASERPFDGTDLLTLGGRYTVRGHAPDQALQGQRISVARISATALGQHLAMGFGWQPWLGWDLGRVERPVSRLAESDSRPRSRQAVVLGLRWQAGSASGELIWARATGPSPVPRQGQWQAQAAWRF